MTSPLQAQRMVQGERAVLREVLKRCPNLTDKQCDVLINEAKATSAWQSAMAGNEPFHTADVMDQLVRSDLGALILSPRDDNAPPKVEHAKALADMSPEQRMTYARKHGLA